MINYTGSLYIYQLHTSQNMRGRVILAAVLAGYSFLLTWPAVKMNFSVRDKIDAQNPLSN